MSGQVIPNYVENREESECTNRKEDFNGYYECSQQGIMAGVKEAGARLVVVENVYMYGPNGGKPLTEDLPYAATTRKGRTRARMAEELLSAHTRGDIRVAIGRASDFFGPNVLESALGERVFVPVLTGKAVQVIGNPDLLHSYTYVSDIGKALG